MTSKTSVELLRQIQLFADLTEEQLTAIVEKSTKTFFEEGSPIIVSGKPGKAAYLVLSGTAITKPPKSTRIPAEELGVGTLIGEIAALADTRYSLTIVAKERLRALMIERETLHALMEIEPAIAGAISEKLTERLIFLAHDLREVDAKFAMFEASMDEAIAAFA